MVFPLIFPVGFYIPQENIYISTFCEIGHPKLSIDIWHGMERSKSPVWFTNETEMSQIGPSHDIQPYDLLYFCTKVNLISSWIGEKQAIWPLTKVKIHNPSQHASR